MNGGYIFNNSLPIYNSLGHMLYGVDSVGEMWVPFDISAQFLNASPSETGIIGDHFIYMPYFKSRLVYAGPFAGKYSNEIMSAITETGYAISGATACLTGTGRSYSRSGSGLYSKSSNLCLNFSGVSALMMSASIPLYLEADHFTIDPTYGFAYVFSPNSSREQLKMTSTYAEGYGGFTPVTNTSEVFTSRYARFYTQATSPSWSTQYTGIVGSEAVPYHYVNASGLEKVGWYNAPAWTSYNGLASGQHDAGYAISTTTSVVFRCTGYANITPYL